MPSGISTSCPGCGEILKYFIDVLAESYAASIIVAAVFALARSEAGLRRLAKALAAAFAVALLLAILRELAILGRREYLNVVILSATTASAAAYCLLLWVSPEPPHPGRYADLRSAFESSLVALLLLYSLPTIFMYVPGFLMPGESPLSTELLLKVVSYAAGMLLSFLSGLGVYKVASSLPFKTGRSIVTLALGVNALGQTVTLVQALLARRVIPMNRLLFRSLVPLINHHAWFLWALMAVTIAFPVILWLRSLRPAEDSANPASGRKLRAAARGSRRWSLLVVASYAVALLSLTVLKTHREREAVLSPAEPVAAVGEELLIPLDAVGDGHLHRFSYPASDGTEVRFIVIKKNQVAYGVGLDACDICGPTGYYERDGKVVCKLCDVVMNVATIGFKGGCNPVPLAYRVREGRMVIRTAGLEAEKGRFKR